MQNFVDRAREIAETEGVKEDPNAEIWAARAFSVIAVLGNGNSVSDEIAEALAQVIARAPVNVMIEGSIAIMAANAAVGK